MKLKMTTSKGEKYVDVYNLCPHHVTLVGKEDTTIIESHQQIIPRRTTQEVMTDDSIAGVPIVKSGFGFLVNLPDKKPDTYYIVSLIVAQYANRDDLLYCSQLIKDSGNHVIGCQKLSKFVKKIKGLQ